MMDGMSGWGMGFGWGFIFVIALLVVVTGIYAMLRKK
jgi:hypothetical protein